MNLAFRGRPDPKGQDVFFTNYEGFRQALNQTSVAIIPDCNSYNEAHGSRTVGTLG